MRGRGYDARMMIAIFDACSVLAFVMWGVEQLV